MQFKIKKQFVNPKDMPADYFSSLVGWTNRTAPWPKGKVVMENTPGPFHTDTPAPNEPVFIPLVNKATGKTYREENHEFSAELADIEKLLKQMFQGGGTWK